MDSTTPALRDPARSPPACDADVLIIGAGPAGLALACALADGGLRSTVIERLSEAELAAPPPDGRDIALTHRAMDIMCRLGLWQRLPEGAAAPLRQAQVFNAEDPRPLRVEALGAGGDAPAPALLGQLVPNHEIRRVSLEAARARALVTLLCSAQVLGVETDGAQASVTLRDAAAGERTLHAPLLVAADSRFSETRRRAGIGAQMRDFGRTVVVCRMRHAAPNNAVAQECFHTGHTLAVLPLNGGVSSIVLTVRSDIAQTMLAWPDAQYAAWVERQLSARLGAMQMDDRRQAYPLVGVYAHHFVAPRFALVGDAAVGMHPVTAHGYNFGLYGVESLSRRLVEARGTGLDLGALDVLRPYEQQHRRETLAMYHGTNAIVGLFTDDRLLAQRVRAAVIRAADHIPPLKSAISRKLTEAEGAGMGLADWLPPLPPLPPLPEWIKALRPGRPPRSD